MNKVHHIHLVSDSTGETVSSVARACLVQFESIKTITHPWWLVRSQGQVERVLSGIRLNPGIVLSTLIDKEVRTLFEMGCQKEAIQCISILDPIMVALTGFLEIGFASKPGRQHILNAEYFGRIDAIHYTLAHDDGQAIQDIDKADIIIVGVSRTSKTPTSMYLANRGLKTANIPLINGLPLPKELLSIEKKFVVGLTMDTKSLTEIRQSRLNFLDSDSTSSYANPISVKEELLFARQFFLKMNWPIIDVSRRSIEEVASAIMQMYEES
jgi:regulator of PEP synthase PpsR (kinase-PPPase family)